MQVLEEQTLPGCVLDGPAGDWIGIASTLVSILKVTSFAETMSSYWPNPKLVNHVFGIEPHIGTAHVTLLLNHCAAHQGWYTCMQTDRSMSLKGKPSQQIQHTRTLGRSAKEPLGSCMSCELHRGSGRISTPSFPANNSAKYAFSSESRNVFALWKACFSAKASFEKALAAA